MIQLESLCGESAKKHMNILASFRIQHFREYPYLYDGTMAYEQNYLEGFFTNPDACLIIGWHDERPIAVSTVIPLLSDYDIAKDAEVLFAANGLKADTFMYFGEIIILPEYRGVGLASRIFAKQEDAARKGYAGTCYLAVEREDTHILKPEGYQNPKAVWNHMGYLKTNMTTQFTWPTIQKNGSSKDQQNTMAYWIKEF